MTRHHYSDQLAQEWESKVGQEFSGRRLIARCSDCGTRQGDAHLSRCLGMAHNSYRWYPNWEDIPSPDYAEIARKRHEALKASMHQAYTEAMERYLTSNEVWFLPKLPVADPEPREYCDEQHEEPMGLLTFPDRRCGPVSDAVFASQIEEALSDSEWRPWLNGSSKCVVCGETTAAYVTAIGKHHGCPGHVIKARRPRSLDERYTWRVLPPQIPTRTHD